MQTTVTTEKGTATVEGTLTADEMEQHFRAAAREASEGLSVKGFRPGKIPYETVANMVDDEQQLLQKVVERALQWALPQIYEKEALEVIGEPDITVKKLAQGNPFEFEAAVPVLPEIELPSLDGLSATRRSVEVSEEETNNALEHLQRSRAKMVTVERPAEMQDRIEIDFTIEVDGVPVEDGKSKNHPIVLGKDMYVPGFEEKIVGMSAGETKEFDIDVPEEYKDKRIAGRRIHCTVTMNLVQEQELPELTNEFAASLGAFSDLDALRENIAKGLQQEKEEKENQRLRIELVEDIAKELDVDVPDVLVERELNAMMDEFERSIAGFGASFEEYLKHLGKTKEEMLKEWEDEAEKRVRIGLALHAIAKDKGFTVDPAAVEERVNETLKRYGDVEEAKEKVDMQRLEAHARSVLLNDQVFEFLEKKATIKEE